MSQSLSPNTPSPVGPTGVLKFVGHPVVGIVNLIASAIGLGIWATNVIPSVGLFVLGLSAAFFLVFLAFCVSRLMEMRRVEGLGSLSVVPSPQSQREKPRPTSKDLVKTESDNTTIVAKGSGSVVIGGSLSDDSQLKPNIIISTDQFMRYVDFDGKMFQSKSNKNNAFSLRDPIRKRSDASPDENRYS